MSDWQELNLQQQATGVTLKVRVQPKASRNGVAGLFGDSLKVQLTAPPVDGAANEACAAFLAAVFGLAKRQVRLVAGQTGRTKTVALDGIGREEALARLEAFCAGADRR